MEPTLFGRVTSMPISFFREQEGFAFNIRLFAVADLLAKLNEDSVRLETVLDIRQAIKTGDDERYIFDKVKNKRCRPILRGKDVRRYSIVDPGLYVDYGGHLACPRSSDIFEQPKILIREAGERITVSLDTQNFYVMSSLYNAILRDDRFDLRYILGLINSKLFQFLMWKIALEKTQGAFAKAKIFHYYALPVKNIPRREQHALCVLVDQVLVAKTKDCEADTAALESQIDQLVYKLYGLTEEEIAIVEGRGKTAATKVEPAAKPSRRRSTRPAIAADSPRAEDDEELE